MSKTFYLIPLSLLLLLGAGCQKDDGLDAADLLLPGEQVSSTPTDEAPSALPTDTASSTTIGPVPLATSTHVTTTTMEPVKLAFPGISTASAELNKKIRIKTSLGDIVIQLLPDAGPRAASNFIYLVKQGFYTGTIFHRVIPGFMIQGGDPTGTGRGGPGYQFANDAVPPAYYADGVYKDGYVAMANAGRDTNGSQFFIMVEDYPLPTDYSVFGKVVSGLSVAHAIAGVNRDGNDRPLEDVKMISVTVEK